MREDIAPKAKGNEAALMVAKKAYDKALSGDVSYFAVIMCGKPNDFAFMCGGHGGMETTALGGMVMGQRELEGIIKRRNSPPINANAPANIGFYNCLSMPLAYDFLPVLIKAELDRRREGAPGPLQVGWFWGPKPEEVMCLRWQQTCFDGVLRPMLKLVGAVENNTNGLTYGRNLGEGPHVCGYGYVLQAYERGEEIPKLRAPEEYREETRKLIKTIGQAPVTITLREASHHEFRNSNIPEWLKLADWLKSRGEYVVFIRDTEKADEGIDGYTTCSDASKDLLIRVALYEQAKCNLFVSNGPAMLPVFMDCPWLMFNDLTPDRGDFPANTEDGWRIAIGFEPGGQWPWAKPNQRIVWKHDKFEAMRDAWLEYMA